MHPDTSPLLAPEALFAQMLQSEFDIVRLNAVQGLRDIGAAGQSAALIAALRDPDEDVRQDAAGALGLLGITAAVPALMDSLQNDPCGDVKLACVGALGRLGADTAAPVLRQLVTGRADGLIWDEEEMHQDGWDDWLDVQIAAITALGNLRDSAAIEPIVAAIHDENAQEIGPVATSALAKIGVPALPTLGVLAQSRLRRRRLHAIQAIAEIGGEGAHTLLTRALEDEDPDIRLVAYDALLDATHDRALLFRAMEDAAPGIRIAAFARLDLEDEHLLGRIINDPAPEVQLAMIDRLDLETEMEDEQDLRFRVLDTFSQSPNAEVSARAFAALAALATDRVAQRLTALLAADEPDTEQRQWALVDALSRVRHAEAGEWLQKLCRSPYRAVRLKALASLGQLLGDDGRAHVTRQQAMELLMSFALPPAVLPETAPEDIDEAPREDIAALEAAGLDVETTPAPETGPTSSLGAILGHDEIAQELTAEAEAAPEPENLSPHEQALLSRARKQMSRRKISLDGDGATLDREARLTALQLLGSAKGMQDLLAGLCDDKDGEATTACLAAFQANVKRYGLSLSAEAFSVLLDRTLGSSENAVRLQALRLAALAPRLSDRQRAQLRQALKDGDAHLRVAALKALLTHGKGPDLAVRMLDDPSIMVRQQAMRLLGLENPDLAAAHAVAFLLQNPEQRIESYVAANAPVATKVHEELMHQLTDREARATWPLLLRALAALVAAQTSTGELAA